MENESRIIDSNEINMESFEEGYKKCYQEIVELDAAGKTGYSVEILFKENGLWSGRVWQQNCSYSNSDLERNGDYKLNEIDVEIMDETLRQWRDEVNDNMNF